MFGEHEVIELVIKVISMEATHSDLEKLRAWAAISDLNKEKLYRYHNKEILDPSFDVTRGFDKEKNWLVLQDRLKRGK